MLTEENSFTGTVCGSPLSKGGIVSYNPKIAGFLFSNSPEAEGESGFGGENKGDLAEIKCSVEEKIVSLES